ncbi:MAG: DinB family protein [bacterium]
MKKSDIKVQPEYFERYINLLEDMRLSEAMDKYGKNLFENDKEKLISAGDKVYAPGKWTVKDILQHLIDTERIFNYRALRFARNDNTILPGFEQDDYAKVSNANKRSLDELLNELEAVRRASIILFESFDDEMLLREGICFDKNISVLAIGFVIAGHTLHHVNVIKEKYLTLINY